MRQRLLCRLDQEKIIRVQRTSILLQGFRNIDDGLWDITLLQTFPAKCKALLFQNNQLHTEK